jgi:hypothetical protein
MGKVGYTTVPLALYPYLLGESTSVVQDIQKAGHSYLATAHNDCEECYVVAGQLGRSIVPCCRFGNRSIF